MHKTLVLILAASLLGMGTYACSDDVTSGDDADDDASASSSSSSSSSGGSSSSSSGGASSSSSSGGSSSSSGGSSSSSSGSPADGGTVRLTIDNYLAWCSVSINGGAASTGNPLSIDVAPGTEVTLLGDKASNTFVWGYWYGTADDQTAQIDDMATTVTVDADMTVQACCPFANDPDTDCPVP